LKELTNKEFYEAPALIQLLFIMAWCKTPIGSELYLKARKEHPEYFEN